MIIANLHKQVVALDPSLHRNLRIHQPQMDWSVAAGLNALFVDGTEFGEVCREYPILFVRAGADAQGKPLMAPIAAMGLAPNENLFLQGSGWRAAYIPALLRAYPFAIGRVGAEQPEQAPEQERRRDPRGPGERVRMRYRSSDRARFGDRWVRGWFMGIDGCR